jgi:uncharacterized glyoxalase superfamily protein PhnB
MKIGFVRVFVSDFEKSLEFHSKTLGMEIDFTDKINWAQFKSGQDVSLAIENCSADRMENGGKLVGRFVGVTLMVDAGVKFSDKPEKQPWGGTTAQLHDLDGMC